MKISLWKHCRWKLFNMVYYHAGGEYNCWRILWFGFEWERKAYRKYWESKEVKP